LEALARLWEEATADRCRAGGVDEDRRGGRDRGAGPPGRERDGLTAEREGVVVAAAAVVV